ncbi:MAG: patatin-like phospholipase family protein [Paramuribaculum sp.]|nr:patatin-like phospholipase family protein [Paramuribaculum sp.]
MFKFLSKTPYRIGVALSGGGARGFAHAGALKAMEDMGIRPDILAGVSAGSVAAVMYAGGMRPEEIVDAFKEARFSDFAEIGVPRQGFFSLERFRKFLSDHVPYEKLEDLPLPVVIGATDFDNCVKACFESGPLVERVVASCSIPIVFRPVVIDGVRYVDGGVLHNLPAWTIRDKCKYLIGVNCSPMPGGLVSNSIVDIAMRSYHMMLRSNIEEDLRICDMVVSTDSIGDHNVFSLSDIERVYRAGYSETVHTLLEAGFRKPSRVSMMVL